MPKMPKMRWRKRDYALIDKVIKNQNAKLRRLEKKGVDMSIQPDKLSKKKAMESIKTRADFNRFIASAQAYTKRGAEAEVKSARGARTTKWAVQKFEKEQKEVNKKRAKQAKEIGKQPVTSRGKPTGNKRAEMGTVKENAVKPSNKKFENMSQKEWEKAMRSIEREVSDAKSEEQKAQMKENYIKAMINVGIDDTIIAIVENVPLDEFVNTVINDQEGSFDFVYSPEELHTLNISLRETWEAAAKRSGIDVDDLYFDTLNDYDEE